MATAQRRRGTKKSLSCQRNDLAARRGGAAANAAAGVPSLFRVIARWRVAKNAEYLAESTKVVHREQVIRAFIFVECQDHALSQPTAADRCGNRRQPVRKLCSRGTTVVLTLRNQQRDDYFGSRCKMAPPRPEPIPAALVFGHRAERPGSPAFNGARQAVRSKRNILPLCPTIYTSPPG